MPVYGIGVSGAEAVTAGGAEVLTPCVCGLHADAAGGPHRDLRFKGMVVRAVILRHQIDRSELGIGDDEVLEGVFGIKMVDFHSIA